jgi:hypothetical protein
VTLPDAWDLLDACRCFTWRLRRFMGRPLLGVGERLARRLLRFQDVEGLSVGVPNDDRAEQRRDALARALSLLRDVDPRRFARLSRDVKAIFVLHAPRPLLLAPGMVCVLGQELVDRYSAALVASRLVHESVHARVERSVRGYVTDMDDRVETLCRRAEREFARRLPTVRVPEASALLENLEREAQELSQGEPRLRRWRGRQKSRRGAG